jgi:hypothetical protein
LRVLFFLDRALSVAYSICQRRTAR